MRPRVAILLALLALGAFLGVFFGGLLSAESEAAAPATPTTTPNVLEEPIAAAAATAEPPVNEAVAPLAYDEEATRSSFRPKLTAGSFVAIDADEGRVLIAHAERARRPIASLTKMMTALIVIEDGELDRKIRVPKAATLVEPSREGLRAGRWYPRRLLLYSALLVSANDSAEALGYAAGDGSLRRFYRRMNERAAELGMTLTHYQSTSGLEDESNLSTALDQAILARAALENRTFAKIVRTRRKLVDWPPPTYAKEWINHNKMLVTYEGTYGVKTGYTTRAGACLVVAVERNGHHVIGVLLDSTSIWADMPRLIDAAFRRLAAREDEAGGP
ncbi:MAG: hypothetical protein U0R69_09250 [Gaiellales bacterium]